MWAASPWARLPGLLSSSSELCDWSGCQVSRDTYCACLDVNFSTEERSSCRMWHQASKTQFSR